MSTKTAPLYYQQTNADGTFLPRPVSGPIPFPHIPMVPEKVYVQKLPGRGLACVRRRVPSTRSPFGITAISEAFGMPRAPSSPSDNSVQEIRTYSTGSNRYDPFYPQALHVQNHRGQAGTVTPNPPVYTQEIQTPPNSLQTPPTSVQTSPIVQAPAFIQVSPGLKTTIITETNGQQQGVVKHSCAFCGKYRSGSYQLRHPLRPGEMPKARFCKKCTKEETSSEDSDSSYKKRRKKKHRHHRHSTESSDESSSDRKKGRRQRRRSVSRHRSRRSDTRSSSVDGVRITLARTDESRRSRLATRRRRSSDPVRIVRHVRHVNRTEPSRHQSRDSRDRYSTRGRSEARFYDDGIDRAYISREPSPMRYREPDYLRGYDTLERQRPVRRGTGYYEPPSVAHVRDDYNTGDSAYESGVSDVEIEDPLSPLSRAVRVIRISPETEPRPRSRSRSRSVRITRISSEAEPRSRSRSVRAIRVAQVPRPPSRSVRYLQMSQAPDERRSYESIPDAEQRARSRTPSRHRSSETPFRRRRVRDTSEFESTSSELDHLESPVSAEYYSRDAPNSGPVRFVRTRQPITESDHEFDDPLPQSSIPGVSYVRGRDYSRSRHRSRSRSDSYRPPRSRHSSAARVQFRDPGYMDPDEREEFVRYSDQYRDRARKARESWL